SVSTLVGCSTFDEVWLLPKPCSTRKAARRSPPRRPFGRRTVPVSLRPAEGMVTACSFMGAVPRFRDGLVRCRLYRNDARMEGGTIDAMIGASGFCHSHARIDTAMAAAADAPS